MFEPCPVLLEAWIDCPKSNTGGCTAPKESDMVSDVPKGYSSDAANALGALKGAAARLCGACWGMGEDMSREVF